MKARKKICVKKRPGFFRRVIQQSIEDVAIGIVSDYLYKLVHELSEAVDREQERQQIPVSRRLSTTYKPKTQNVAIHNYDDESDY